MRNKTMALALVLAAAVLGLAGCTSTDSQVVNNNITQNADNFQVLRRITFINGITDKYLLEVEGYCSIDTSNPADLTVTCKVGSEYKRSYLGRSNNVTWVVEQLTPSNVSPNHYQVTWKPEAIIPDVTIR